MKALLRDTLANCLSFLHLSNPSWRYRGHLFIATFHRVLLEEQLRHYPLPGLAVTPQQLEWFINFFLQNFHLERLDSAWRNSLLDQKATRPRLAITFDDGQRDNYLNAAPVLDSFNIPATFFIPVGAVDTQELLWHDRMAYAIQFLSNNYSNSELLKQLEIEGSKARNHPSFGIKKAKRWTSDQREKWINEAEKIAPNAIPSWDGMMSWQQVKDLKRRGHEIGSHSFSHQILVQCGEIDLLREVDYSKEHLEKQIGEKICSFCYPNGDYDDRVRNIVKNAGYELAVTTEWGSNRPGCERFSLKRHDMVLANSKDRNGSLSQARVAMRMTGFKKKDG